MQKINSLDKTVFTAYVTNGVKGGYQFYLRSMQDYEVNGCYFEPGITYRLREAANRLNLLLHTGRLSPCATMAVKETKSQSKLTKLMVFVTDLAASLDPCSQDREIEQFICKLFSKEISTF